MISSPLWWNSLCLSTSNLFAEIETESLDSEGKCNIFEGDWVRNEAGPMYTNRSCSFIEADQNCMRNGRLDTDYLYWRWKPHGCELPPVDPKRFLRLVRNKSWAFIGDSITRNHVQSFLCILSKVKFLLICWFTVLFCFYKKYVLAMSEALFNWNCMVWLWAP